MVMSVQHARPVVTHPTRQPAKRALTAQGGAVLLLEDDEFDAAIACGLLEKFSQPLAEISQVYSVRHAVELLARNEFCVAIVDMNVSDSQGLDTVRDVIRANPNVPVVVLTGDDDIQMGLEALSLGAQEYLPKSQLDKSAFERVVEYAILRQKALASLTQKAHYDALTGVANRTLLYERWGRAMARGRRADLCVGVLVVDIDQFKHINDAYGHTVGDEVLQQFASLLVSQIRQNDVVARLGGDEFVVVLENLTSPEDCFLARDKLLAAMPVSTCAGSEAVQVTASIGAAVAHPGQSDDLMEVIRQADLHMYEQKCARRTAADGAVRVGSGERSLG